MGGIIKANVRPSTLRSVERLVDWLREDALTLVKLLDSEEASEEVRAAYRAQMKTMLRACKPLWLYVEIKCDTCQRPLARVPRGRCQRMGREPAIDSATAGLTAAGCLVVGTGWQSSHYCPDCRHSGAT